jgi:hypothetical protein
MLDPMFSRPKLSRRRQMSADWLLIAAMLPGCGSSTVSKVGPANTNVGEASPAAPALVRFDIRELKPTPEPLVERFDHTAQEARAENKDVVVFFSADWCNACRDVELDLGGLHAPEEIDHVRILQLKEEAWEKQGRLDEFNTLRERWSDEMFTYPMIVLLDGAGKKREDMNQAKTRIEADGTTPTFVRWFAGIRKSAT